MNAFRRLLVESFPRNRRGLLFDAAMLAANLALVAPLTKLVQSTRGFHPLFGALLLLVLLIAVPFAMFYLAPRALFLVEDYRSSEPWLGALLVMAPLAFRLVFGT